MWKLNFTIQSTRTHKSRVQDVSTISCCYHLWFSKELTVVTYMVQNRYNYHYMQCHIPLNSHLWHQNKNMTVQDWLPQRELSLSYKLHARKLMNKKTSLKQNPTTLKCFSNLNPVITTKTIKLIEQFQHSPLHLPISTHFTVVNWKGFKSGKLLMN